LNVPGGDDPATPIYDPPSVGASHGRRSNSRVETVLAGAIAGAATWFLLDRLGAPQIAGISNDAGMVPFSILGGALGLTRFRRAPLYTALTLIALATFVSFTDVFVGPARRLIRVDPLPKSADAIVVLSAGITADGQLTQQSLDRMLAAVRLAKSGIAPALVVSREERTVHGRRISAAADQARIASLAGIAEIISTGPVKSTHEEALEVARIARSRGWNHIVLVTSPFHSRRACRTFEALGLVVSCIPGDSRDVAVNRLIYPHDRMRAFALWLYEVAGTLRYRQLGWI
jgi:uncharacterized SAM-binding protein YcdF (DUF218 family)